MRSKSLWALALFIAVSNAAPAHADPHGIWAFNDANGFEVGSAAVETNAMGIIVAVLVQEQGKPDLYYSLSPSGKLSAPPTGNCAIFPFTTFILTFTPVASSELEANYNVTCEFNGAYSLGSQSGRARRLCPNGVLDPGEDCDDGNQFAGDCCVDCKLEPGCGCADGVTQLADSDGDGVPSLYDDCPGTLSHVGVDNRGCALEQFCAKVDATTEQGRKNCPKLDWNNDEPRMKRNSRDCRVDHGGVGTADDRCVPAVTAPCLDGYSDCDGDDANGCEVHSGIDLMNCGGCDVVCPSAPNAQPVCLDSTCGILCDAGRGDCDGDPGNGCETDLTSDELHCGTCANACAALEPCRAGTCGCPEGTADCDGDPDTVCETTLHDNPTDCGACGNACSGACLDTYCREDVKLVFASSESYTGNVGGLSGADNRCAGLAAAAGLGGTFRAWLSEFGQTNDAATRLTHSAVPYVLVTGRKVADDWNDLVDGNLDTPIHIDEQGQSAGGDGIWTGTGPSGSNDGHAACNQWTDGSNAASGLLGVHDSSATWTAKSEKRCGANARLYCFEQ